MSMQLTFYVETLMSSNLFIIVQCAILIFLVWLTFFKCFIIIKMLSFYNIFYASNKTEILTCSIHYKTMLNRMIDILSLYSLFSIWVIILLIYFQSCMFWSNSVSFLIYLKNHQVILLMYRVMSVSCIAIMIYWYETRSLINLKFLHRYSPRVNWTRSPAHSAVMIIFIPLGTFCRI